MKVVKVSFLGLGVIGSKMLEFLLSQEKELEKKKQVKIKVEKIFVRNLNKKRAEYVKQEWLTDDYSEAIQRGEIIIECLGGNGYKITRNCVLEALNHKKAVIMSSKKCLACYGQEIEQVAKSNHVFLGYDATVGGGIPISSMLKSMAHCEEIEEIYGIINATSNYIMTQMSKEHITYEQALVQAQQLGIAENDPSEDVKGFDALYKAVILAGFGMKHWLNPENLICHGISESMMKKNQIIKQVFYVKRVKNSSKLDCSVENRVIAGTDIMGEINNTDNIVMIRSSESGLRGVFGKGAGAKPTASAMYDDLIQCLNYRDGFYLQ